MNFYDRLTRARATSLGRSDVSDSALNRVEAKMEELSKSVQALEQKANSVHSSDAPRLSPDENFRLERFRTELRLLVE